MEQRHFRIIIIIGIGVLEVNSLNFASDTRNEFTMINKNSSMENIVVCCIIYIATAVVFINRINIANCR